MIEIMNIWISCSIVLLMLNSMGEDFKKTTVIGFLTNAFLILLWPITIPLFLYWQNKVDAFL